MIDVKQLRIGSHIQFNGDMVRVYSVPLTRTESMPASDTIIKTVNDACAVFGFATDFDPIPLTAELLTEIGFVCRPREIAKDRVKNFFIDAESAKIMEETRLCFPQIELSYYSEIGEPELWRVRILCDNKSSFSNANLIAEAEITVRYLHELESFVYLTIGKELIE